MRARTVSATRIVVVFIQTGIRFCDTLVYT